MPMPLYVDCFSGASGDMLLGALLDVGLDADTLRAGLRTLPVEGWSLEVERVQVHSLRGSRARVTLAQVDQPHRGLSDVLRIVRGGELPGGVVTRAESVFRRLAEVEAFIHDTSVEEVEF